MITAKCFMYRVFHILAWYISDYFKIFVSLFVSQLKNVFELLLQVFFTKWYGYNMLNYLAQSSRKYLLAE